MKASLSVAIITKNEEANLARCLESVKWADELVVVDCGSTDRTAEIAHRYGEKFFVEEWRGFAAQKNFALAQCSSDWVLSLDADEEVSTELARELQALLAARPPIAAYLLSRRNHFLGRWMRHGGYYPDRKLRLFPRGACQFEERAVHETVRVPPQLPVLATLKGDLLHHCYGTLEDYIEHMNRYSSLGAAMLQASGRSSRGLPAFFWNVLMNPAATFIYNYFFRLGFLDGREGLLQHLYHSVYVSWKYAKAWRRD